MQGCRFGSACSWPVWYLFAYNVASSWLQQHGTFFHSECVTRRLNRYYTLVARAAVVVQEARAYPKKTPTKHPPPPHIHTHKNKKQQQQRKTPVVEGYNVSAFTIVAFGLCVLHWLNMNLFFFSNFNFTVVFSFGLQYIYIYICMYVCVCVSVCSKDTCTCKQIYDINDARTHIHIQIQISTHTCL